MTNTTASYGRSASNAELKAKKVGLSWMIARFVEDYDPYEFINEVVDCDIDGDEREEVEQGIAKYAAEMLQLMNRREYDYLEEILHEFDDEDNDPRTADNLRHILAELEEIRMLDEEGRTLYADP